MVMPEGWQEIQIHYLLVLCIQLYKWMDMRIHVDVVHVLQMLISYLTCAILLFPLLSHLFLLSEHDHPFWELISFDAFYCDILLAIKSKCCSLLWGNIELSRDSLSLYALSSVRTGVTETTGVSNSKFFPQLEHHGCPWLQAVSLRCIVRGTTTPLAFAQSSAFYCSSCYFPTLFHRYCLLPVSQWSLCLMNFVCCCFLHSSTCSKYFPYAPSTSIISHLSLPHFVRCYL